MDSEIKFKHKLQQGTEKFYSSWISIFVFSSAIVLISLIQVILFIFTDKTISGFTFGQEGSWIVWLYLLFSFPFGIAAMTSTVLSVRGDKKFLFWAMATEVGYFISGVAGGMMWTIWMVAFCFVVNILRYIKINKDGSEYEINSKHINIALVVSVVLFLSLGILSIELDTNNVYWWNTEVYGDHKIIKYLDVIATCLTISGSLLILGQNKHTFTLFIACDFFYLILFINSHQWSNVALTSIFIITSVLAFISWSDEYKNK